MQTMLRKVTAWMLVMFIGLPSWGLAAPAQELTLAQSIEQALKNNPTVQIAQAQYESASGKVAEANAGFYPVLSGSATATRADVPADPLNGTPEMIVDKYENKLTLTWPLYTGGKLEGALGQAREGKKAASANVAKTKQQLIMDVTSAYYNVLQAQMMVKLSQEAVDQVQAHLDNAKAHFAAGTVAKSDVLRAEVELANVQQNLIKAKNGYNLALAALNNLMGTDLGREWVLKDDLRQTKVTQTLDELINAALANRPEMTQAKAQVAASKYGVKAAKGGYQPAIALNGTYGWAGDEFPPDTESWSLTLSASMNLFDSGLTKAKVKEARAGVDEALAKEKQARDGIALEVRQAYLGIQEAEQRIATAAKALEKAQEDLNIAQVRYSAGVGTNIEVLDAQVALTQAKTNYVQALYDFNVSRAKLAKAIGTPLP